MQMHIFNFTNRVKVGKSINHSTNKKKILTRASEHHLRPGPHTQYISLTGSFQELPKLWSAAVSGSTDYRHSPKSLVSCQPPVHKWGMLQSFLLWKQLLGCQEIADEESLSSRWSPQLEKCSLMFQTPQTPKPDNISNMQQSNWKYLIAHKWVHISVGCRPGGSCETTAGELFVFWVQLFNFNFYF